MSAPVPGPTEIPPDLAMNRALWWIDKPRDSSAWLWFGGNEGAGKTALLQEIAGRHPDSIFLDCAGMSCEEVARRLADSFGVAAPNSYDCNFAQAVTRITTGPVVILANTQWAGSIRTTREPERVIHEVVQTLIRNHRRSVRMRLLVEVEHTAGPMASLRGRELTLRGHDVDQVSTGDATSAEKAAFRALALSESRTVPLPVWSTLCSVLGQDISVPQLERLISSHSPDILTQASREFPWPNAAFRRECTARVWRDTITPDEVKRFHSQALSALRSAERTSAIKWYVQHAAAGHAAASGEFESLLEDASTMAMVGHHSLFEAFEAAYHDHAVPPASLAAHLYYLSERGVWPSTHGEWLALLHHSLLSRGPSGKALADRLLAAADTSALPWHTLWAHGTAPGVATTEHVIKRPTVRELQVARADSGSLAIATYGRGNRNAWHLSNGELAADPDDAPVAPESVAADQGLHGWRPAGAADGHVDLPRMPRYVRDAVRVGNHAVMSSTDGVFAITIHSSESETQSGVLKTTVRTTTRLGTADFPTEARRASANWFEDVWGASALKRVAEDALPSSLSNTDAGKFLAEVGLPHVSGFLELETVNLATTGLRTVPDSPVGQGSVLLLGTWQGAQLLLDATSGKVLQDGTSGISNPLAGSSLRKFITMVRLYYWWFASDWTIENAEADLRSWLARIDPNAYATQCWQRVFEDYNFTDRV
ncbi:SUKH-4 family immunity protein [Streptomyces sp. V3I7]|uniref:SUKH-4 family immunity protein n=1 Tax=Streptomyces sp. V3I7 TaxID=3042278 RepID=UPI002785A688|nr:SUKH-4 family immunity protein [Streptomyces sp. V3I7]MDQ0993410.1 hypothetical protein [Streptomyces sp. V3I7]